MRQSRQPRLAEEFAPDLGMVGEEAADVDGERRLVRQHAGVGGAVERGDVIAGIGRAEAPADEAHEICRRPLPDLEGFELPDSAAWNVGGSN